MTNKSIGKRIRDEREKLGWSQEELAKRMGYKTRNAIYQYEQADNMKLSLIEKFAEVLGCPISQLTGWSEETEETNDQEMELLKEYLLQLNKEGFEEAKKRIEELTQLSKYKKGDD